MKDLREENPFLAARVETADRYGLLSKNYAAMRNVAVLLAVLVLMIGAGFVMIAQQNRIVPYVVQVDKHGFSIAVQPAENTTLSDQRVIIATIGQFIQNSKTVVLDPLAQRKLVEAAYAVIPDRSAALKYTNAYFEKNNPFTIANKNTARSVSIVSILPLEGNTWRAEWDEEEIMKTGKSDPVRWTGLFTIAQSPQKDVENIIKNPLGIFISDYTFSQNFKKESER